MDYFYTGPNGGSIPLVNSDAERTRAARDARSQSEQQFLSLLARNRLEKQRLDAENQRLMTQLSLSERDRADRQAQAVVENRQRDTQLDILRKQAERPTARDVDNLTWMSQREDFNNQYHIQKPILEGELDVIRRELTPIAALSQTTTGRARINADPVLNKKWYALSEAFAEKKAKLDALDKAAKNFGIEFNPLKNQMPPASGAVTTPATGVTATTPQNQIGLPPILSGPAALKSNDLYSDAPVLPPTSAVQPNLQQAGPTIFDIWKAQFQGGAGFPGLWR